MGDLYLYRVDYPKLGAHKMTAQFSVYLGVLEHERILVPVERCEHGNVYRHMTGYQSNVRPEMQWCEGAGLEDNDD